MSNNTIEHLGKSGGLFDYRSVTSVQMLQYPDISYDFFTFVPARLKPLYRTIRDARWFLSGYHPRIHNKMLSSNIYQSITSLISNGVTSGGVRIDGKNSDVIDKLQKKIDFTSVIREASYLAEALGWSYAKLDIIDGYPDINIVANDQAYTVTKRDKIVEFYGITNFVETNKEGDEKIFLIEKRYMKDGLPYIKYFLRRVSSQYESGIDGTIFQEKTGADRLTSKNLTLDEVRNGFGLKNKAQLNELLKEKRLPFRDLGVSMVKSSIKNPLYMKTNASMSNFNKIGFDTLVKYETIHSAETHEVSTATRQIMIPQDQADQAVGLAEQSPLNAPTITDSRAIKQTYIMKLPYMADNGEMSKPESIEFGIKSNELSVLKGLVVADIALAIGYNKEDVLNIKTGSQFEKGGKGEKTSKTIEEKRHYIKNAISPLLDEILFLYNIEDCLDIVWLGLDLNNFERKQQAFASAKLSGLMSTETAIRMLYPFKTESEIQEELERIREDQRLSDNDKPNNSVNLHNIMEENKSKIKKGED